MNDKPSERPARTDQIGSSYVAPVVPKEVDPILDAFLDGMSPRDAARARNVLSRNVIANNCLITRRRLVDNDIAAGATIVVSKGGTRRLQKPNGAFRDEFQISKTAMDYAQSLLANKETK